MAHHGGLPLAAVLPVLSNPEFEVVAPQLAAKADAQARASGEALEALAQAQAWRSTCARAAAPSPMARSSTRRASARPT